MSWINSLHSTLRSAAASTQPVPTGRRILPSYMQPSRSESTEFNFEKPDALLDQKTPYRLQGDEHWDAAEMVEKRNELRKAALPRFRRVAKAYFASVGLRGDDLMSREQYVKIHLKMAQCLVPELPRYEAYRVAREEWSVDCRRAPDGSFGTHDQNLSLDQLAHSLFTLADHWVDGLDEEAYVNFTSRLFRRITEDVEGKLKLRQGDGAADGKDASAADEDAELAAFEAEAARSAAEASARRSARHSLPADVSGSVGSVSASLAEMIAQRRAAAAAEAEADGRHGAGSASAMAQSERARSVHVQTDPTAEYPEGTAAQGSGISSLSGLPLPAARAPRHSLPEAGVWGAANGLVDSFTLDARDGTVVGARRRGSLPPVPILVHGADEGDDDAGAQGGAVGGAGGASATATAAQRGAAGAQGGAGGALGGLGSAQGAQGSASAGTGTGAQAAPGSPGGAGNGARGAGGSVCAAGTQTSNMCTSGTQTSGGAPPGGASLRGAGGRSPGSRTTRVRAEVLAARTQAEATSQTGPPTLPLRPPAATRSGASLWRLAYCLYTCSKVFEELCAAKRAVGTQQAAGAPLKPISERSALPPSTLLSRRPGDLSSRRSSGSTTTAASEAPTRRPSSSSASSSLLGKDSLAGKADALTLGGGADLLRRPGTAVRPARRSTGSIGGHAYDGAHGQDGVHADELASSFTSSRMYEHRPLQERGLASSFNSGHRQLPARPHTSQGATPVRLDRFYDGSSLEISGQAGTTRKLLPDAEPWQRPLFAQPPRGSRVAADGARRSSVAADAARRPSLRLPSPHSRPRRASAWT